MTSARELLQQGKRDELWSMYCGFFDLSITEYMEIQHDLLLEQIQLLSQSELGRKLIGSPAPTSIDEFRENVPLTKYEDYTPYLPEKNEDVLPVKPYAWTRTSGRTGPDSVKWVPYTRDIYDEFGRRIISAMLAASCNTKGEVNLEIGDVVLMTTALPPYTSGYMSLSLQEQAPLQFIPSLEEGAKMGFQERILKGFELAMATGIDHVYALSSLLARIGEQFEQGSSNRSLSRSMLNPVVIYRLLKGFLVAKLNRRGMLPSDLWNPKSIISGGTDTHIYRDAIEYYWGRKTHEGYGATESGAIAQQAWNYKGMTFYPNTNFWEFIPLEDHLKSVNDPSYQPKTLFMDEVTPGIYELVFTNFHGGIFTRYRIFDLIDIFALRDEELDIDLPQFRFFSRSGDVIDLASMVRLTEKTIWSAIEGAKIQYEDWTARKEEIDGQPVLHLYIEEKQPHTKSIEEVTTLIHKELCKLNQEFVDFVEMFDDNHLRVTRLPEGAFARYIEAQRKAGADLAHLKPAHMKVSDEILQRLTQIDG
jgi:hypothetical protein